MCSDGPSSVVMGLYPRKAAKSDPTGGRFATWCATVADTPWAVSPANIVDGNVELRPAIISEKKMPIDSVMPLFWNVASMPDATPRRSAGTAFITPAVLGATNMPIDTPTRNRSNPNGTYAKLAGRNISNPKPIAEQIIPAVAKPRAPSRSERNPEVGPPIRNPAVSGNMKIAAQKGV